MAIFRGTGGQGDSTTDTTITVVTQKAADAAASASAAASSASSASGSATNAATSATNAATSEANAATSETNAATSETNASASETNAATSATNAATSETNAATSATNAETSKVAAQAAQTAAELAETNAETAETNAQASATTATTKAGEASTSAATATTQAGIATTKASEASSSATDAQTAQTAAELKLDQFDDRYLGSKTSDPTLDNDGNALLTGALYWNSTSDLLKIYTGSAWVRVISEVSQDTTPQLGGELDGQTNKITNIGDPTSAQDAATKTYVDSQVQSKDALSELSGDSDDITEGSTNLFLTTTERTKLSGIEASATADQTASEILTAIKTVDGSGSGLDADLLDGNEASAFATSAQGSTADSALQNISEDTTPQLGGNLNTNGNDIIFGNDDKARFGTGGGAAGGSLLISATATESTIAETGSGDLTVKADTFKVTNANGLEDMLIATPDAGVELYHNDVKKFETTSNGAQVTGNLNTTTILATGDILTFTNIQVGGTVDGRDVATDGTKLDGIETNATSDQTASEIRTLVDSATDSNVFTDADHTKLDGIESGATADQTAAEIKTAYESNADTNAFTDAEQTKLSGIETGATADQTASEILTAIKTVDGTGSGLDADTLDGSHASAFLTSTDLELKVCHLKTNQSTAMVEGPSNEFTVNFNLESHNDSSFFSHSSGVITVLETGWHRVYANMVYQNATSSQRTTVRAFIKKNGTAIDSTTTFDYDRGSIYGEFSNNKIETLLYLTANDTLEIANYAENEDGNASIEADMCEFIVTRETSTGSTTNADTVDSLHASSFIRSDADDTATGQLELTSGSTYPLIINGSDNGKLVLQGSSSPYIRFKESTTDRAYIQWNGSTDSLHIANQQDSSLLRIKDAIEFSTDGTNFNSVWHGGNDGTGSGLDADLLDGNEATAFATAAQGTTADSALQNVVEDTSPQLGGSLDTNGYEIAFDDNKYLKFGASNDITIGHASTYNANLIDAAGALVFSCDSNIIFKKGNLFGEFLALMEPDGAVKLYHNNVQKFETTSTGIKTFGNIDVNGAYTLPTSDGTNGQVLTTDGSGAVTFADASGGGSSLTIKDEGTSLSTAATTINFTGSGVTATGTGAEKTVNIPSVAKYTEFDLAPGATSVTLSLSGDSDVQKVELRLAARAFSSGPNNPTFTAKTDNDINLRWDIQGMKMSNYTDTITGLHIDGTTDLYSFLNTYNDHGDPAVFTFYKSEGNRWTCEATIATGTGTTGVSYVLHCRTDYGYSYSDIGSFVFTTGSSSNWTTFDGTIVEYFK